MRYDFDEEIQKSKEDFRKAKAELKDASKILKSQMSDAGKVIGKKINAFMKNNGLKKLTMSAGLIAGVATTSAGIMQDDALKTLLGAGIGFFSGLIAVKFIKKQKEREDSDDEYYDSKGNPVEREEKREYDHYYSHRYQPRDRNGNPTRESNYKSYEARPEDIKDAKPRLFVYDIENDEDQSEM